MPRIPAQLKLLSFASFLADFSSEMTFPILPLFMANVLHMTTAQIGLVEGIALSTIALMKFLSGYLSDRLQVRRPFVWGGYLVCALSKPFLAGATSWPHVFGYKILDRSGKGIREPPRDALIASYGTEVRGRFFGFHRAIDTLGAILGVSLTLILLSIWPAGYRIIFLISAIPVALAAIMLFLFLKEQKVSNQTRPKLDIRALGTSYLRYAAIGVLFGFASVSYSFFLLRSHSLGVAAAAIPLIYLLYNILYAVLSYPAGMLSDFIKRKYVLAIGYLLLAITAFGFAKTGISPWLLMAIYGAAIAFTDAVGAAFISDSVPARIRASALGIYQLIFGFSVLAGNVLFGVLSLSSVPLAFTVSGSFAFIAALLVLFI